MPKLIFYRQERNDGAIRTGLELDGVTIAERYEEGGPESDPALLWYVDLRCEGPGLPDDPDAAGRWLLDHSATIREGFARYADGLRAGADPNLFSLTWAGFEPVPDGVAMKIACSAARRADARRMPAILAEMGERWDEIVRSLDIPQEVGDLR